MINDDNYNFRNPSPEDIGAALTSHTHAASDITSGTKTSAFISDFATAAAAAAPVTSVNSQTGVVSLSTTNISEGTNLYFTDERAQDAVGTILSSEFTYNDGAPSISINSISNTKISGLGTLATQSGTFSGTSSGTNTGDQSVFTTIAVSGQSDVVADTTSDTLTLAAGSNITITTNAGSDTITISASGGGGGLTQPQVMALTSWRF